MSIQAQGLAKAFGERNVVDGVTLEVAAGEVYGLIGPNGAGKTTTLRMLAGLMRPSAGRALICGHDVEREPRAARSKLAFQTGTTGLYERLTPLEVLTYFGRLYGVGAARLRARIDELAVQLRIEHLRDRRCGTLSTGERQRVSLARALVHDPPVLILDEPTAGLDVLASRYVAEVISRARAAGKAILLSTHYMTEAELLCGRIGLIHDGRLLREGAPGELKAGLGVGSLEEAFLRLVEAEGRP